MCFSQPWQSSGLVGLETLFSRSCLFFLSLPVWTEARVHLDLLYCATGKLPIRAILWLNTESRSFIKKLICYSLPLTHCFSVSHTLPFSTGSCCHTPASFLRLSSSPLYTVFILSFSAVNPPTLLGTPMDSPGYNVAFFIFSLLCKWNYCSFLRQYGKYCNYLQAYQRISTYLPPLSRTNACSNSPYE